MPNSNAYMAKYMLERYHSRRREAIAAMGGRCVGCGTAESLEFDHIDRALKRGEIAKWLTQGRDKYLGELKRCQLLCRPCHVEKTRREISVGHGGGLTGVSGCPCEPCKARRREYMRDWRKKRQARADGAIG